MAGETHRIKVGLDLALLGLENASESTTKAPGVPVAGTSGQSRSVAVPVPGTSGQSRSVAIPVPGTSGQSRPVVVPVPGTSGQSKPVQIVSEPGTSRDPPRAAYGDTQEDTGSGTSPVSKKRGLRRRRMPAPGPPGDPSGHGSNGQRGVLLSRDSVDKLLASGALPKIPAPGKSNFGFVVKTPTGWVEFIPVVESMFHKSKI